MKLTPEELAALAKRWAYPDSDGQRLLGHIAWQEEHRDVLLRDLNEEIAEKDAQIAALREEIVELKKMKMPNHWSLYANIQNENNQLRERIAALEAEINKYRP